MIISSFPTLTDAQTSLPDLKRDTTTTLEKTDGNPDVNQTISTDDYIIKDTPDLNSAADEDISFTTGVSSSGDIEDFVDMDAVEERAQTYKGQN